MSGINGRRKRSFLDYLIQARREHGILNDDGDEGGEISLLKDCYRSFIGGADVCEAVRGVRYAKY